MGYTLQIVTPMVQRSRRSNDPAIHKGIRLHSHMRIDGHAAVSPIDKAMYCVLCATVVCIVLAFVEQGYRRV